MFTNVWAKYLPVIRIVLKRSLTSEQIFALNLTDFERAGLKKKSGYKFMVRIKNGRQNDVLVDSPVASAFVSTLTGDDGIKNILADNEFQFTLSPKFELTIKHIGKHDADELQQVNATEV